MRNHSRGQSLVEFALLLPVFVLFVVVIFDLGRAIYYYSAIYNAAREGARFGAVQPSDTTGMRTRAVNYAIGLGMTLTDVTAGAGPVQVIDGFPNPTVRVQVVYTFQPVTPLVDRLLPGGQLTLRSEAVMRTEVIP